VGLRGAAGSGGTREQSVFKLSVGCLRWTHLGEITKQRDNKRQGEDMGGGGGMENGEETSSDDARSAGEEEGGMAGLTGLTA
jgi:hypothetical protein